jgi:hypothetical protein
MARAEMAKTETWAQRYGAKRQASDRAILEALEREIAAEEGDELAARQAIGRAFGRPVEEEA